MALSKYLKSDYPPNVRHVHRTHKKHIDNVQELVTQLWHEGKYWREKAKAFQELAEKYLDILEEK